MTETRRKPQPAGLHGHTEEISEILKLLGNPQRLLIAYLLTLLTSLGVYHVLQGRHWFGKHLTYRALAETLRARDGSRPAPEHSPPSLSGARSSGWAFSTSSRRITL